MNFREKPKETFNKVRFLDYYMEGHAGFIAGGCFKNIFKNQKIKDLDIFFEKESDFLSAKSFFESNEDYIFSITRFAYARKTEEEGILYYNVFVDTFFEDLTCNKLVIDGNLMFPVSSFERSYRYRSYGFGLCKESKSKLIEALKTSNTDDLSNDLYFGLD